jgi:hypothetical protein
MAGLLPRQPMADDLLRTADVAVWINKSSGWLDQGRMRGYGPPCVRIGWNVFYRRGDVQDWIKSQTNGRSHQTKMRRTKMHRRK